MNDSLIERRWFLSKSGGHTAELTAASCVETVLDRGTLFIVCVVHWTDFGGYRAR